MHVPRFASAKIISYITFLAYAYTQGTMGIEVVFVGLTLIQPTRRTVAHFFPLVISIGSETLVAIDRIQVHT